MMNSETKRIRESSIFYLMGVAPMNWTPLDFAEIYKVTPVLFEQWVVDMGIPLKIFRNPYIVENSCTNCGILCESTYCSVECKVQKESNNKIIREIKETGIIPVTIFKNTYYVIDTGEVYRPYVKNK